MRVYRDFVLSNLNLLRKACSELIRSRLCIYLFLDIPRLHDENLLQISFFEGTVWSQERHREVYFSPR